MSTEKKPTATVKASFISTKTEDTKVPAKKEEKKVEKKTEKKVVAAKAEKKAPAAKAAAEVVLQWNGNDYTYDRLLQSAKDVWQYDQGKNVADFKKAVIYVKPEEGKAYVVVNDTDELSFDI